MKRAYNLLSAMPCILLGMLLPACSNSQTPETVVEASEEVLTIGDPAIGKEIFETGGTSGIPCASCHSIDGTALVGPTLQGISVTAGQRVSGQSVEDYLRASIVNPSEYIVEGFSDSMNKDYAEKLSEEDINGIIAYLLTLPSAP